MSSTDGEKLVTLVLTFPAVDGGTPKTWRGREEEDPLRPAWLEELKKGDGVVIRFKRGLEFEYYAAVVDLVGDIGEGGPRRIYADGSVFNAQGEWGYKTSHFLVRPTPDALEEVERTRLLGEMSELNWRRLPVPVLTKVVALIKAETGK